MQAVDDLRSVFEQVVRQNYRLFYVTAFRVLRNAQDAEDAAQMAVLKGFQNLETLQNPKTIVGWLARITHNTALDMLKQHGRSRTRAVGDDTQALERPSSAGDSDRISLHEDDRQVLFDEIEKLPQGIAQVLTLRHLEGLEIEQVAERLGITANLARVRLFRGYERLRASRRVREMLGLKP